MKLYLWGRDDRAVSFWKRNLPAPSPLFQLEIATGFSAFSPGDTVLIPSEQATLFRGQQLHLLTCGRCCKDTFTFSSREEERAVIALMRTLDTPAGLLDPIELPATFPPDTGDFALLGAAAVRILSGQTGPLFFR